LTELDSRVVVRRNEKNLGWVGNLNECIRVARGKYLVFLCDDDVLLPGMIGALYTFMQENPGAGFAHTAGYAVGFSGRKVVVSSSSVKASLLKSGKEALSDTGLSFDILFSSVMVRAECFRSLGNFVESISADYEMWVRISSRYDVGYVNAPYINVYAHAISPRMTPELYISESVRLRQLVMPLFSYAGMDLGEFERKSDALMALGLRSLGAQAMHAGYWSRGLAFLSMVEKYDPKYIRSEWLKDILKAIPRRLQFVMFSREITSTHV
jgi:glycosyltransferase involved in cell wall biosynthesis